MAQSWNSTANRRHLPSNTSRDNAEPEKNDALLPRRFTKATIGVLVVSGVVVVGLQSYIFYNFTQMYDGNSLPSSSYSSSWDVLYTAMAMSSGSANALVGFFMACVIKARRRLMMIFGTVLTVVAAAASALAGFYAIAEQLKLYNNQEIPQHVCVGADAYEPLKTDCIAWWWLELTVLIFSGFALIANFACFVILCIDLYGGHYRQKLQRAPPFLDVAGSVKSGSTQVHSIYDDHSTTRSDQWIPRVNSFQSGKSSDIMRRFQSEIDRTRPRDKQQIVSQNPSLYQNRPSLPIVIRKNTSSIYFY
ncbi:uncharacterized protein LOC124208928 [Daphnia pulex]|uniref:uncharacterized protein LOC124208928 n=1 Tax=Daphnia pulex TaxID=6669 RepID=UPI001EE13655|nr:uncharacterized protein LOC124208928 [Daphnia pulex]XP_046462749.1 uncharacterized protein LOC124208928 [Daphnia pulex]